MSWICPYCSTNNFDSDENCIVCDSPKVRGSETLTKAVAASLSGDVIVPEQYGTIGSGAFKGRTDVTSITLHDNVTKIMDSAFEGCTSLRDVKNANRLATIRARAFWDCRSLAVANRPKASYVSDTAFGETMRPAPPVKPAPAPAPTPVMVTPAPAPRRIPTPVRSTVRRRTTRGFKAWFRRLDYDDKTIFFVGIFLLASFLLGQAIQYTAYGVTHKVFILTNLRRSSGAYKFNTLAFLIATSVVALGSGIALFFESRDFILTEKARFIWLATIPYCVTMLLCPAMMAIIWAAVAVLMYYTEKRDEFEQFSIGITVFFSIITIVFVCMGIFIN